MPESTPVPPWILLRFRKACHAPIKGPNARNEYLKKIEIKIKYALPALPYPLPTKIISFSPRYCSYPTPQYGPSSKYKHRNHKEYSIRQGCSDLYPTWLISS